MGMPLAKQRLIYKGRVLKEDAKVSEVILTNDETIHLMELPDTLPPTQNAPPSEIPNRNIPGAAGNPPNLGNIMNMVSNMLQQPGMAQGMFQIGSQVFIYIYIYIYSSYKEQGNKE